MISLEVSHNITKKMKLSIRMNGENRMKLLLILVFWGVTGFGGALYQY